MPRRRRYAGAMPASATPRSPALVGWRLLALLYDFFPVFGLWFLVAALFVLVRQDAVRGGMPGLLEFAALWAVTGVYAVVSWRRGGQTLGMRPWRLRVAGIDGGPATWGALLLRYAVGGLSLLLGGLGFWWAWVDRERLTWHDRASRTRMVRLEKSR